MIAAISCFSPSRAQSSFSATDWPVMTAIFIQRSPTRVAGHEQIARVLCAQVFLVHHGQNIRSHRTPSPQPMQQSQPVIVAAFGSRVSRCHEPSWFHGKLVCLRPDRREVGAQQGFVPLPGLSGDQVDGRPAAALRRLCGAWATEAREATALSRSRSRS